VTWDRLDDGAADHPKEVGLSDRAFRAWIQSLCYCARHLTDGVVPRAQAKAIAGSTVVLRELTSEQVPGRTPLWHCQEDGSVLVHDFVAYNPTRARMEADRNGSRERMQASRERRSLHVAPDVAPQHDPQQAPTVAPQQTPQHAAQQGDTLRRNNGRSCGPVAPLPIPSPSLSHAVETAGAVETEDGSHSSLEIPPASASGIPTVPTANDDYRGRARASKGAEA